MRFLWIGGLLLLASVSFAQGIMLEERDENKKLMKAYCAADADNYVFVSYWSNNLLQSSGRVKEGKCEGVWKQWNEQGHLIAVGSFRNGLKNGTWKFYSPSENTWLRVVYKNNQLVSSSRKEGGTVAVSAH